MISNHNTELMFVQLLRLHLFLKKFIFRCAVGQYQSSTGATGCLVCYDGQYQANAAAASCSPWRGWDDCSNGCSDLLELSPRCIFERGLIKLHKLPGGLLPVGHRIRRVHQLPRGELPSVDSHLHRVCAVQRGTFHRRQGFG